MMTKNGVSTTKNKGQFQCEAFRTRIGMKEVTRYQWDYREENGDLYSGIAKTFEAAIEAAAKFGYDITGM